MHKKLILQVETNFQTVDLVFCHHNFLFSPRILLFLLEDEALKILFRVFLAKFFRYFRLKHLFLTEISINYNL